ncbi:MAG TPA: oxidoreductase [Cryomorphaceae bacterium]|nr:oxidoreductase [Owenweeksia sp.]MBF99310.1 oxidoreductase [Owenweeksia sp.]HAD97323.1 oxidoreductase [Cryomorphaceae bacterium]HCQ16594.1 oxidoreductase [Cryomorphaceae bacterium]|tara:strand:- start:9803 stop:11926 length:2124 start_codon:yes stop_codon:yes gene_type:complete
MEQLIQSLKDGAMQLMEVPFPALQSGQLLIRNHYSVISPGTEGKTVKDARLSYIGKAKARKEEVKKVITSAQTFGLMKTYKMVMNKLEAYSPLGYSCAGEVIAIADDVSGYNIGDYVACGGNTAGHSEVVCVPANLCVKVSKKTPLKEAAFTTIGAIALQGIRQSELKLGESCLVIGLGIIGQLSLQLLHAAGVKCIGIDIDENQVQLAKKQNHPLIFNRNHSGLEELIVEETGGFGVDAVLITASTSSSDPVELAGRVSRKKGKVIIVGAVPTGFSRQNYFKKELDLRMSSSYGPGRYESAYEEKGLDYPIGYVRWTENRNMQAFADLVENHKIDLNPIISHEFDFEDAAAAYQLIVDKKEVIGGIVLKYDTGKELKREVILNKKAVSDKQVNIGLVGAGSFAQNFLLPALKGKVEFIGVATARPTNSRYIADKYGFGFCAQDASELIRNTQLNTVFIATRHNTHARYVIEALHADKNVFVEKPLCLNETELEEIKEAHQKSKGILMIGFNRRFAPFTAKVKKFIGNDLPVSINYRINAGQLPADHWVHDPEIGGGRIIGEACHFIDLAQHISGSAIDSVAASAVRTSENLLDNVTINLSMKNGSIANISYFSNGSKKIAKEYLEVFGAGKTAIIDDFKKLTLADSKVQTFKSEQDKGYVAEVSAFAEAVVQGKEAPIPSDELFLSTLASFKVIESVKTAGEKQAL